MKTISTKKEKRIVQIIHHFTNTELISLYPIPASAVCASQIIHGEQVCSYEVLLTTEFGYLAV
jgi:hypothetical protein